MTSATKEDDASERSQLEENGSLWSYVRIFSFADATGAALNFASLVAAIGAGASLPLMTIVFGRFVTKFNEFAVGDLSPGDFRKEVNSNALWFIYLFAGRFVLGYMYTVCLSVSAMRTTKSLRVLFLRSALRQEVGFFDVWKGGSAAVKVTTDFNRVHNGIAEKLGFAVQSMATLFAAFIVAFVAQWKLTLITAVIIPTILIVTGICAGIDIKQESAINRLHAQACSLAEEVFSSMRTVQAFWAYRPLSRRYGTFMDAAHAKGLRKWLNLGVLYSTEFGCVYAGYALAFWQGIRMFASGEIQDPGKIVTVIFAIVFAASSISQVAGQITVFTGAASAASGLYEILDRKSQVDPLSQQGLRPGQIRGQFELNDVRFAYPSRPDFPVLNGVTLSIPSNKTTALVGASGSGKSTLIGLIERWYQPSGGSITMDGVPLNDLSVSWLRSQIRLVGQEPVLFQGTIEQNVLNGLMGTNLESLPAEKKRELLEEACKVANAHDFITELPQGYQTQVGNAAGMLSGGQKQRIAIARSIISNPAVLLMDEPTSALDSNSEHVVQDALDKAAGNRTTVIIAHKLATIRKADNIAVLSGGVIVEQGTFDELKAKDGAFARMISAQHLGDLQHQSEDINDEATKENIVAHVDTELSQQLTKEPTRTSRADVTGTSQSGLGYGLLKCVRIVIIEHRNLWMWNLSMLFLCIMAGLAFPAQGILFAKAVEVLQLQGEKLRERGNFFALMFFVLSLANFALYFAMAGVSNTISQTIIRYYRMEMFANLLRQDLRFFDKPENASGALASRLSSVPAAIQDLLGFNIALILIIFVNIIASSVLALIVGWKLGLAVVFGVIPPLVFFGYLRIRLETKLEAQNAERFSESASLAGEAMNAIRTISSLSMELDVIERYTSSLEAIERRAAGSVFFTMFWFALSQSLDALALGLGFWYGGKLISQREYTTTQFFIVFTAVFFGAQAAAQFFGYTTSMSKATSALNYLLWLRTVQPVIQEDDSNRNSSPTGNASVCLESVRFAYPNRPGTAVLKGITAKVDQGQFAAIVGASGCGKSTVIALLERFYDPTSGRILFGNDDISKLSPRLYRRNASLVQQEPSLYEGSIFDNIALGVEEDGSEEMVRQACRQANILDFVSSLPEGLSTSCGSRGAQLSGGQRQRIAIARALIRNPKLLLLDEATSALDTESERIVQEALLKASTGRTTVVVAHRLSTIVNASVIFVFSAGKIVEVGNHDELLNRRGIYYNLCVAQALDQA